MLFQGLCTCCFDNHAVVSRFFFSQNAVQEFYAGACKDVDVSNVSKQAAVSSSGGTKVGLLTRPWDILEHPAVKGTAKQAERITVML